MPGGLRPSLTWQGEGRDMWTGCPFVEFITNDFEPHTLTLNDIRTADMNYLSAHYCTSEYIN